MAFVKYINRNSPDSHQTSPGYVLTFIPWSNRDTFNYKNQAKFNLGGITRDPLIVTSDAVQVQISSSKSNYIHTMAAVLYGGDVNYSTAIAPGDFVFVNLLNWETDVLNVYEKAKSSRQINKYEDGFKGVFKVQSVERQISQSPNGPKTVTYTIQAAGFTEFNNIIHFNPAIVAAFREKGAEFHSSILGDYYANNLKANADIQEILRNLIKVLIGKSRKSSDLKVQNYGNTQFIMPPTVAKLMGRPMSHATDLFNYIIGIWKNISGQTLTESDMPRGFNPNVTQISGEQDGFYQTGIPLQGNRPVFMENWNNATAWSILKSQSNEVLNEMFTAYKLDVDGNIMPTIIARQKPFTSEYFKNEGGSPVTKFLSLPRWKVSPDLLLNARLGRQEASRFNFVQVFTRALADTEPMDHAQQIAMVNFFYDKEDISRHGLKPYIQTSNFDFPTSGTGKVENKALRARYWASLVSDWVIGAHLKESGSIEFMGIQEPIAIGDNLELDGIVYHIETITHTMTVMSDGKKSFKTAITVSNGVDARSEGKSYPVYPEMEFPDMESRNKQDYNGDQMLPGLTTSQNTPETNNGEFPRFSMPRENFLPETLKAKTNDRRTQDKPTTDNQGSKTKVRK